MAQPCAMASTCARASDAPFGESVSKVSQSPIQKSSWWYSAAVQLGRVGVAAAAVATVCVRMPKSANATSSFNMIIPLGQGFDARIARTQDLRLLRAAPIWQSERDAIASAVARLA